MKRLFLSMLLACAVSGLATAEELPIGTSLDLRLSMTVHSDNINEGDAVQAIVLNDVKHKGIVFIKQGEIANLRVEKIQEKMMAGMPAVIALAAVDTLDINGERVLLDGALAEGGNVDVSTKRILTDVIVPFAVFRKGKPAVIPEGKIFRVKTGNLVSVSENDSKTSEILEPKEVVKESQ